MNSSLPKSVVITDDTMREGLQIESPDIPVSEKLRLLDAIGDMGAKVISIGSFAHPKWTPSMACIDELAERQSRRGFVDKRHPLRHGRRRKDRNDQNRSDLQDSKVHGAALSMDSPNVATGHIGRFLSM